MHRLDHHAQAFEPLVRVIAAAGAVPGLQIGHAGRKASANRPWEGDDHIPEGEMLENPHWPYLAAKKLGVERAAWTLPAPYAHWLQRYRT